MEIRQAILKAADHIEENPELFDFDSTGIPRHECGAPGCAIGWVSFFMGLGADYEDWEKAVGLLLRDGLHPSDIRFYARMDQFSWDWCSDPGVCAQALRQYADKYHPETPEQFPEIRRELDRIFDGVAA